MDASQVTKEASVKRANASQQDVTSETFFYELAKEGVTAHQALKRKGISMSKLDAYMTRSLTCEIDRVVPTEPQNELQPFVYEPLTEPRMCRLLVLHKGSESEPLEGSLSHHVLGAMVDYEPISYAWGSDTRSCSMVLNGYRMPLTQSLHNALRRMRYDYRDRAVWADGVCINQADDAEKAAQVSLMPQIFEQTRTWAYLGPEADNSNILPAFLKRLFCIDPKEFSEELFGQCKLPPLGDITWQALLTFFTRPWFTRLWVFQEAVVAKDLRFLCGDWELSWWYLLHVAEIVCKLPGFRVGPVIESRVPSPIMKANEAVFSLGAMLGVRLGRSTISSRLYTLTRLIRGDDVQSVLLNPAVSQQRDFVVRACRADPEVFESVERFTRFMPSPTKPPSTPILILLTMCFFREATKPQDRLYVIAGLAEDVTLADFPADYGETIQETNVRFSKTLIHKGLGMDVLFHATKSLEMVALEPSWTVDWTTSRTLHDHWLKLGWAYKEGFPRPKSPNNPMSLINDQTIKVSGYQLDRCCGSVIVFPSPPARDVNQAVHLLTRFIEQANEMFRGDSYFTGESWLDVWTQTLTANDKQCEGGASEALIKFMRYYDRSHTILESVPNIERSEANSIGYHEFKSIFEEWKQKQETQWLFSVVKRLQGHSLCKTSKGYVGVVPNCTKLSDEIFMIEGSDMPFVLRPIPGRIGYYSFVGGCYIHGLMRGKAWQLDHENFDIFLV